MSLSTTIFATVTCLTVVYSSPLSSPMVTAATQHSNHTVLRDCDAWYAAGNTTSAMYNVSVGVFGDHNATHHDHSANATTFHTVWCDMSNDTQSGWIVIQRRVNNTVSFNRNMSEYQIGFGNMSSNYWIGLELIHNMTNDRTNWPNGAQLNVTVEGCDGTNVTEMFSLFMVGHQNGTGGAYVLTLVKQNRTLDANSSSLVSSNINSTHNGRPFATFDQMEELELNCPGHYSSGGWWYGRDCGMSNLNAEYVTKQCAHDAHHMKAIRWAQLNTTDSTHYQPRFVQMAIRAA